ncbi:alpha-amlyase [Bacteroidia bacterium]|nr:alpha-amlyase [Bacteroidia bacterium]
MNVRQITPSGTFAAAQAELLRLQEMGVDVVWLMPVQPIGVVNRKGSLGSYYAIKNYTDFNPEFGQRADFERFMSEAHRLGLRVILDWVANHTSPDHLWTAHNHWHKRNEQGSLKVQYDWTDIAELDYTNAEMQAAMRDAMLWWVKNFDLDGFRCDMAMLVPTEFWESATAALQQQKPDLLMLAEAEEPALMHRAFDAFYAWNLFHTMNDVAQGKAAADALWTSIHKQQSQFVQGAVPLLFTSNHDENSWNGTEFERMGTSGAAAFAAFCYLVQGLPLIYTGQEMGNRHRLAFFEKDNIERVPHAAQKELYSTLNHLRKSHPALWCGNNSTMQQIHNLLPQQVFSVLCNKDADNVLGVFNFSNRAADVKIDTSLLPQNGTQLVDNQDATSAFCPILHLEGWEYKIFVPALNPTI